MKFTQMKDMYVNSESRNFYDHLLGEYDQMIDWESRLERESPFFEKLFADYGVNSVLDAGCGTGRHCFHFAALGAEIVVGADVSAKVVELAKSRVAAIGSEIRFVQAGFTELADRISGPFKMVCVLGNSISHLLTYDDLELAFKNLRRLVARDGVVVIHLLNWERKIAQQERFFPPRSHPTPEGDKLFFRFLDFHEELVTMNLAIFQQETGPQHKWNLRTTAATLRPWRREILRMAFEDSGLKIVQEYGGMDMSPYHPANSPDYLVVGKK